MAFENVLSLLFEITNRVWPISTNKPGNSLPACLPACKFHLENNTAWKILRDSWQRN